MQKKRSFKLATKYLSPNAKRFYKKDCDPEALKRCPQAAAREGKRKRKRLIEDGKKPTSSLISPKFDSTALKHCISKTATREELSEIRLSPVAASLQKEDIVSVHGTFQEQDPFLLNIRPSEGV